MAMSSPVGYETMEYRRCGRSGLKLPALSLGLWHNFGANDDYSNAREMVLRSFDAGVTHFDLANNYGPPPGSAEQTFGRILREDLAAHRDELIISTKAGYYMWPGPYGEWGSRKYLLASLDQSLQRMGLDYVDIFYSHRPDPETPLEETMGALVTAVKSGKALYVGISSYYADITRRAADILRAEGVPLLIHQPVFNLFDRWVEDGLSEVLRSDGIGCIPFSPLAQGLLAGRYNNGIAPDSRAGKPDGFLRPEHVTEEKLRRVSALTDIAAKRGQSLAQMSIAWLLAKSFVTSVLIGASRWSQIEDNLGAMKNTSFSPDELTTIDKACKL
ncbi:MAG: L-glyceraldehyde 3-phosphate reductase [Chthoniobacterales bacterium]|nr:L-glyceraldehyde 3-phosphate reductase [Chthoniobacterales bacterium]